MTPARRAAETANKRAERQRRREAGYQRVEIWLDEDVKRRLAAGCQRSGVSIERGITMLINDAWPVHLTECSHCADLGLKFCMIDHGENQ